MLYTIQVQTIYRKENHVGHQSQNDNKRRQVPHIPMRVSHFKDAKSLVDDRSRDGQDS